RAVDDEAERAAAPVARLAVAPPIDLDERGPVATELDAAADAACVGGLPAAGERWCVGRRRSIIHGDHDMRWLDRHRNGRRGSAPDEAEREGRDERPAIRVNLNLVHHWIEDDR